VPSSAASMPRLAGCALAAAPLHALLPRIESIRKG
jgi:hypothetical protein